MLSSVPPPAQANGGIGGKSQHDELPPQRSVASDDGAGSVGSGNFLLEGMPKKQSHGFSAVDADREEQNWGEYEHAQAVSGAHQSRDPAVKW